MTSKGLLAVWMDVKPGDAADFAEWYIREHIPERVGVPGFLNGNRYHALSGNPHNLAVYDTKNADVLSSAPYQERLDNPTQWTQRVMPTFQNTVRSTCSILKEAGRGLGGVLRTWRIEPGESGRDALRAALIELPITDWVKLPGVVRIRIGESTTITPPTDTAETKMRGRDTVATFVMLADLTDASTGSFPKPDWKAMGAAPTVIQGEYALMYQLSNEA